MKKIFLLIIGLAVLCLIAFFLLNPSKEIKKGEEAPHIDHPLIGGGAFNLNHLKGKYVLIDFWGSWCGPCRKENPQLVKLYDDFKKRKGNNNERFEILSIALEKKKNAAKAVIKKDNMYWPYHLESVSPAVLLSPLARDYGISSIPHKILIDPEGKIMSVNPKISEVREQLGRILN